MKLCHCSLAAALAVLALLAGAWSTTLAAEKDIPLGRPYRDGIHGFVLRPPAAAEKVKKPSPTQLISWAHRDPDTGAIDWDFTVLVITHERPVTDLRAHARELTTKMVREDRFKLESVRLGRLAGQAVIDIRGLSRGAIKRWQRQVWAHVAPDRFLVFVTSGLPDQKARLQAVANRTLATVEFIDPAEEKARRQAAVKTGARFLAALTPKALAAAARGERQWFVLRREGKALGFAAMEHAPGRRAGQDGVEVRTWGLYQPEGEPPTVTHQKLFSTAGPLLAEWVEHAQTGTGEKAKHFDQRITTTQRKRIVCEVKFDGAAREQDAYPPQEIYLPRALRELLPRLVDLDTEAVYGFAVYDPRSNQFDYYTFKVAGPVTIEIDGRRRKVTKVVETPSPDSLPNTLYLDEDGRLLRMQTQSGVQMERSDRAEVLRTFPEAGRILRAYDRP